MRIFRDLRAHNALVIPELHPDTDPDLLATHDMPADVERLLGEPLQTVGVAPADDAAAISSLHSLSLDFPESGEQLRQTTDSRTSAATEPAPSPFSVPSQQAAVAREIPQADPADEKVWVYQDPSGVLQVRDREQKQGEKL